MLDPDQRGLVLTIIEEDFEQPVGEQRNGDDGPNSATYLVNSRVMIPRPTASPATAPSGAALGNVLA